MAGVRVTPESALRISSCFACVRVLSETTAALPLNLMSQSAGKREKAYSHPLYTILHDQVNDEMPSFIWKEKVVVDLSLHGNHYSYIDWDQSGNVRGLWPLIPSQTALKRDDLTGQLYYQTVNANGEVFDLPSYQVLHIPALGMNGLVGLSPVAQVRESFGFSVATEQYGNVFFKNGANMGLIVKYPGKINRDKDSLDKFRSQIQGLYAGVHNSHKVAILEETMSVEKLSMPMIDVDFINMRKFSINDIARIYRVPPHMIGDLDRATFSNIEQQSMDFAQNTMLPWLTRIESYINFKLLTPAERKTYYAKFNFNALLRADLKTRYDAYSQAVNGGWKTPNEVRDLEDENPLPTGIGDMLRMPANTMPAETAKAFWSAKGGDNNGKTNVATN